VIHGLSDLRDRDQTFSGEMCFRLNQPHALNELFEVVALWCPQSVLLKKRDDRLDQIISPHYAVLIQMLFVVVVSPVLIHLTHAKERLKQMQTLNTLRALCNCKRMRHLEPGPVSPPVWPMRLSYEVDRKASFSVYKTSDPAYLDQSFLLIVRIRRIVTARLANTAKCLFVGQVPRNTRIFQHIARFY
jgi:hypothetical protein